MGKNRTAMQQAINQKKSRYKERAKEYNDLMLVSNPTIINLSRIDFLNGVMVALNEQIVEDEKLLEIEKEQIIAACEWGLDEDGTFTDVVGLDYYNETYENP